MGAVKLAGEIHEFPEYLSDVTTHGSKVLFCEGDRLWDFSGSKPNVLLTKDSLANCCVYEDKLWLEYHVVEGGKDGFLSECRDFNNVDKILNEKVDTLVCSGAHCGRVCVSIDIDLDSDSIKLNVFNLDTEEKIFKEGKLYGLAADENYIFARTPYGEITCFDTTLNIIWQQSFNNKEDNSRGVPPPQLYHDLVIVNVGIDQDTGKNGEVVACSKGDGSVVWSRVFECEPSNCLIIGDAVYLVHAGRMIVLDAGTGVTLVDEPSGFEGKYLGDTLWSDGNRLFLISHRNSQIRIFSNDGKKLLQEIKLPGPYTPQEGKYFQHHNGRYFLILDVRDYCLKGVIDSFLVLEESKEEREPSIKRADWPVLVTILTIEGDNGDDFYHVAVTGKELVEVLRYGAIKVKEIISTRGSHIFSDERRNPNFAGKIQFSTNIDDFKDGAEEEIKAMLFKAEQWAKEQDNLAGNGKDPIHIEYIEMPDIEQG